MIRLNSRLQPEEIGLGTSSSNSGLLQLNYTYTTGGQADNNSNVLTQRIRANNGAFDVTQTYTYDAVNHLKSAKENLTSPPATEYWKQTFDYDRFGNRTFNYL